jgi:hypothetical protein
MQLMTQVTISLISLTTCKALGFIDGDNLNYSRKTSEQGWNI